MNMMGDKQATLRMARKELEDLYLGLGVPESVDLPSPSAAADDHDAGGEKNDLLVRSSTNIFAYKLQQDDEQLVAPEAPAVGLRLSPSSTVVDPGRSRVRGNYKRRPGIPHSNLCTLCNSYIYLFRHRCLVCGRVYCRRCVGAGMGEMTEGRKCIDCLGRRYSHRYIHRAGTNLTGSGCCTCFWGYYPDAQAVKVQELVWAEKGPAPRRRPRQSSSSSSSSASISTSYSGGGGGGYYAGTSSSASINMTMSINNGFHSTTPVLASASTTPTSSFVVSSSNPHAFPL